MNIYIHSYDNPRSLYARQSFHLPHVYKNLNLLFKKITINFNLYLKKNNPYNLSSQSPAKTTKNNNSNNPAAGDDVTKLRLYIVYLYNFFFHNPYSPSNPDSPDNPRSFESVCSEVIRLLSSLVFQPVCSLSLSLSVCLSLSLSICLSVCLSLLMCTIYMYMYI